MEQAVRTINLERTELREVSAAAIAHGIQVSHEQAETIVDQLEYGELAGKQTHGFVRVPWLASQALSGHEPLTFEKTNNPITYVDCSQSVGYLAASEITSYIKGQLQTQPTQTVIAKNIFPTNTLGYHVRELTADDTAISLLFGTTPNLVTGPGMDSKTLGTNPLAIGFSHQGIETIADITTASASLGELLVAKYWGGFNGSNFRTSTHTRPQSASDLYEDGRFTGSITPQLENHAEQRLYALNMMLQMVTGLVANTSTPNNRGNLVVTGINKALFDVADILPAIDPGLLPGFRSHTRYLEAAQRRLVTVPAVLWQEIQALPS